MHETVNTIIQARWMHLATATADVDVAEDHKVAGGETQQSLGENLVRGLEIPKSAKCKSDMESKLLSVGT